MDKFAIKINKLNQIVQSDEDRVFFLELLIENKGRCVEIPTSILECRRCPLKGGLCCQTLAVHSVFSVIADLAKAELNALLEERLLHQTRQD